MMKTPLFCAIAAAAAFSASAAVVNFTWTGDNASITGTFTYTPSGNPETSVTSATAVISGGIFDSATANPAFGDAVTVPSINFNHPVANGPALNGSTTFEMIFDDINNGPNNAWQLTGTVGTGSWQLNQTTDGGGTFTTLIATGDNNLTAVPEPEMMAAVAGVGLVAFGVARRKISKA